jgi:hypothetical protein
MIIDNALPRQVMLDALKAFGVGVTVEEGGDVLVIQGSAGHLHPPGGGTLLLPSPG